jgi:hypothetical protein
MELPSFGIDDQVAPWIHPWESNPNGLPCEFGNNPDSELLVCDISMACGVAIGQYPPILLYGGFLEPCGYARDRHIDRELIRRPSFSFFFS